MDNEILCFGFQDPSVGTGTKNYNHVLTELLRTLVFTNMNHRELARTILLAAPDQIAHFLPWWKPGFVPRSSEKWTETLAWLGEIYCDLVVPMKIAKSNPKTMLQSTKMLILPSFFDKELQNEAFVDAQPLNVPVTLLKFLSKALIRAYQVLVLVPHQAKAEFIDECRNRFIDVEVVVNSLLHNLEIPNSPVGIEDLQEYAQFLILHEAVFPNQPSAMDITVAKWKQHPSISNILKTTDNAVRILLSTAENEIRSKAPTSGAGSNFEIDSVKLAIKQRKQREEEEARGLRVSLSSLLLNCVRENPRILPLSTLNSVLGSYNATLSTEDQNMLRILLHLDYSGHLGNASYFSLFGKTAQRYQQLQASQGIVLPFQPNLREFVDGLDQNIVAKTSMQFPIRLPLCSDFVFHYDGVVIYDPRYLMPNFVSLVQSSDVNVVHFIESGCLGIVVAALGSLDPAMRAAAGYFLQIFSKKASTLRFKGKEQLFYLIEQIRRANNNEKPWPNLWTTFIIHFLNVMFDTENHIYQLMMEFLLVKPNLSLDMVPEFLKLFESGAVTCVKERKFILELLRNGIRQFQDYQICARSHVFELILSMFRSPLSTNAQDLLITEVLLNASRVAGVGRALISGHGLFTWMTYHLGSQEEPEAVSNLVQCAGNCLKDLIRAKRGNSRRTRLTCYLIVGSLLTAADESNVAGATESALRFLADLIGALPTDDGQMVLMEWNQIAVVARLALKHLRLIRVKCSTDFWRSCSKDVYVALTKLERSKLCFSPNIVNQVVLRLLNAALGISCHELDLD